jgi:PIN domain nuclease of toxin-antitoxin system
MSRPILLDTCALIWISNRDWLREDAVAELRATSAEQIVVSPISAWEVGQLVSRGRLRLAADPLSWFNDAISDGLAVAALPASVLVSASFLPSSRLRDPADRILAATARAFGYRLMTRDRPLLDFAAEGHMQAIAC